MAKKERNRRSGRKARQQERAAHEALVEASQSSDKKTKKAAAGSKKAAIAKAEPRKGLIGRITGYFSDVRMEMHRVTWPDRSELKNYTVTVIVMLVLFGLAVWLVDTGFVAGLVAFTGLRG